MKNLTVQKEKKSKEEIQVEDKLRLEEEFKNLINSKALQNSEVNRELYFIREAELDELPRLLVSIVDEKLGD